MFTTAQILTLAPELETVRKDVYLIDDEARGESDRTADLQEVPGRELN